MAELGTWAKLDPTFPKRPPANMARSDEHAPSKAAPGHRGFCRTVTPPKIGKSRIFQSSVLQDAAPSEPSAPSTALAESTIGKFLPR